MCQSKPPRNAISAKSRIQERYQSVTVYPPLAIRPPYGGFGGFLIGVEGQRVILQRILKHLFLVDLALITPKDGSLLQVFKVFLHRPKVLPSAHLKFAG